LRDPAPGVHWDGQRVYPPRAWEESVTRELDHMTAEAARPALGPVPSSAQAVLFLDYSEMLACLTADWLQGKLRSNWWWSTLLERTDAEALVLRTWIQSPELAPAAMAWLTRAQLPQFLRRLPENATVRLLDNVRRAFAIPYAQPVANIPANSQFEEPHQHSVELNSSLEPKRPASHFVENSEQGGAQMTPIVGQQSSEESLAPHNSVLTEPWLPTVPEASAPGLSVGKRILAAQALMLHRSPAIARAAKFQQELVKWQLRAQREPEVRGETNAAAAITSALLAAKRRQAATVRSVSLASTDFNHGKGPGMFSTELQHADDAESERELIGTSELAAESGRHLHTIESSFAGVLFLLNVALYLKLYSDFTSPLTPSLELNIWDFICLLGVEFVREEMCEDKLFDLLAALAGRNKFDPIGTYFAPPDEWRLPDSWIEPFPEVLESRELVCDGRLQLLHPAGFVISDKPIADCARGERSLSRWVKWVSGYIGARLALAIGREDATQILCRIAGRVACTPTRVDVFYSLETYPIQIRLAGLDRDPGWIPAAGRYVAYHFQ
jgi:hypothetical protein